MKKNNILKPVSFLFISSLLIFTSCKKDNNPAAPALPPQMSFVIDFSDFSGISGASLPNSNVKSDQVLSNYQTAALTVGYWNTILYTRTAIPTACSRKPSSTMDLILQRIPGNGNIVLH